MNKNPSPENHQADPVDDAASAAHPTPPQPAAETTPRANGAPPSREQVIDALKTCFDPEIPVDIYELGLIYEIEIKETGDVVLTMTLTSPACPVAETLPVEVEQKVCAVDGVSTVRVDITWDPPWTPERMSDVARLELNL